MPTEPTAGELLELPAWLYWLTLAGAVLVAAYNEGPAGG